MTQQIKVNAIECAYCGTRIESTHRHDFVTHTCEELKRLYGEDGYIAADGGKAYLRRLGNRYDWNEVSVYDSVNG